MSPEMELTLEEALDWIQDHFTVYCDACGQEEPFRGRCPCKDKEHS